MACDRRVFGEQAAQLAWWLLEGQPEVDSAGRLSGVDGHEGAESCLAGCSDRSESAAEGQAEVIVKWW